MLQETITADILVRQFRSQQILYFYLLHIEVLLYMFCSQHHSEIRYFNSVPLSLH